MIRPLLHKMMMDEVKEHHITLLCNSKVRYLEHGNKAGVETKDGTKLTADVIVAADGVHSKSWSLPNSEGRRERLASVMEGPSTKDSL